MGLDLRYPDYSPVGDVTVLAVSLVMIALMLFSYVSRTRSYRVFLYLICFLMLAAASDLTFYMLAVSGNPDFYPLAYVMRCLFHAFLLLLLQYYVIYIMTVTSQSYQQRKPYHVLSTVILVVILALDTYDTLRGASIRITETGIKSLGRNVFFIGYFAYLGLILFLLNKIHDRLYKRVMRGFYATIAISFSVLLIQGVMNESSYTVASFLFPIIGMFYIMHSNPYDAMLGSVDSRALDNLVRYNYERKKPFAFMSLYLRQFDEEGRDMPEELKAAVRRFTSDFFKGALLFQVGKGHEILVFFKERNPDFQDRIGQILKAFEDERERFGYDYKIVIGESIDEISRRNEYVSFIRNIHFSMAENSIHRIAPEDISQFSQIELIVKELENIYERHDLDDPRVLVYCQPVYNIKTRQYDTAEALMRLKLGDSGLVLPSRFIPLAEENGYIHVLTEIILNKTCKAIKRLTHQGYQLSRISVNVSTLELKDDSFCQDIIRIIDSNGIPGDKIALELTESRSDNDFILMRDKIGILRERGIKIYLDDFGTGYSNMERIMALPFDIIKFDRSMLLASESSKRSEKIVESLAGIFSDLHYSVLYEGVESETDEQLCMDMFASYLQGYKYSRPVPIEELAHYFEKKPA